MNADGKRVPLLSADVEVDENNLWRGGADVQERLDGMDANLARLAAEVANINRFEWVDYNGGILIVSGDVTILAGKYYRFDEVAIEPEGRLICNGIIFCRKLVNNGVLINKEHIITIP